MLATGVYTLTEMTGFVTGFQDGRVTFVQDANGNRITADYDSGGRLSALTNGDQSITFSYNSAGRITAAADSLGRTTTYEYDATNKYLTSVTDYNGYSTLYTYAADGTVTTAHALASVTHADGTQELFDYDGQGRLLRISAAAGAQAVEFRYAAASAVSAVDAAGGTTTYYIDDRGLVGRLVDPLGHNLLRLRFSRQPYAGY